MTGARLIRLFFLFFSLYLATGISSHSALALGIGVSPSEIVFDDRNPSATLHLLNPTEKELSYRIQAGESFILSSYEGMIAGGERKPIAVRARGNSGNAGITVLFYDPSHPQIIIPGVTVKTKVNLEERSKETVFQARKLLDHISLKGYRDHALSALSGLNQSTKGILIVLAEIGIGLGIYGILKKRE